MKYRMLVSVLLSLITISQAYAYKALPFVYSIKYLCGLQQVATADPPFEPAVKPGNYATAINIHNYHRDSRAIMLRKVVVANGVMSQIIQLQLQPNESINVDCARLARAIPSPLPLFVEGFVEIASTVQLSVSAAYTTQGCIGPATSSCSKLGELAVKVVPQHPFRDQ